MVRLLWDKAESDLNRVDQGERERFKQKADEYSHPVPTGTEHGDHGWLDDGSMWHRVACCTRLAGDSDGLDEDTDGLENYVVVFQETAAEDYDFEVLRVVTVYEMAELYYRNLGPGG